MKVTKHKECFCHTCDKFFHYLGIARHRMGHRKRKEDCEITFTHGNQIKWSYSKDKK